MHKFLKFNSHFLLMTQRLTDYLLLLSYHGFIRMNAPEAFHEHTLAWQLGNTTAKHELAID